jgi:hypothetical protein
VIFIVDNDHINDKNVCLIIKGGKLTANNLAKAMKVFLNGSKKVKQKMTTPKNYSGKGQQTVKQLTKQGQGVSNIEVNDGNIKAFESVARKYGVDFAVKKDKTETPPKYLVFFKARDADAITAAFKEFSAKQAKKSVEKPSVIETLKNLMEKVKNQVLDITKHKDRGRNL